MYLFRFGVNAILWILSFIVEKYQTKYLKIDLEKYYHPNWRNKLNFLDIPRPFLDYICFIVLRPAFYELRPLGKPKKLNFGFFTFHWKISKLICVTT